MDTSRYSVPFDRLGRLLTVAINLPSGANVTTRELHEKMSRLSDGIADDRWRIGGDTTLGTAVVNLGWDEVLFSAAYFYR